MPCYFYADTLHIYLGTGPSANFIDLRINGELGHDVSEDGMKLSIH